MSSYLLRYSDGTVGITTLVDGFTIEDAISKMPQEILSYREVVSEELPVDREFRNAWVSDDSGPINVDNVKAKDIALKHLRSIREEKFKSLDAEFIQALSANDNNKLASVRAKQQELRDVTNNLKNLTPKSRVNEEDLELIRSEKNKLE